jgi:choline kinase
MATRMASRTGGNPKCLLTVGGVPILRRIIDNVTAAGVEEIVLVLGYRADVVRRFVKQTFPFHRIRFAMNPKFDSTNNAFSLLMARNHIVEGTKVPPVSHAFLLLDADIVFSSLLLPALLKHASPDKIAVRVRGGHDEEEVRVRIDAEGAVRQIGKTIPLSESYGESVGIEVFSSDTARRLFEVLEQRVRNGEGRGEFYEATFQSLVDEGIRLHAVDVSDFPSIEIDTPEDLDIAERVIVPLIA